MSGEPGRRERFVACPGCGARAVYSPANPWRPFCSERCRQIDLGAWASGTYRLPVRPGDPEEPVADAGEGECEGNPALPN